MDYIITGVTNKYIYIPFVLWVSIQIFKFILDSIKEKKIDFKRILGAGGMPSAHSAVVCCLATLIGKNEGFDSAVFGLASIFALVVMYDACGVRRAAGKQASVLNKIIEAPNLQIEKPKKKLIEVLGHSPKEVIVGALVGIFIGGLL